MGILRALSEQGAEVVVIAPEDEYVDRVQAGVRCRYIPLRKLDRCGTNVIKDLALTVEFYRIFKNERFDIALLYTIKPNIYGNWAARMLGIKTISTVTGLGVSFRHDNWVNKIVRQLYKLAFGMADRVVFQNNADRYFFLGAGLVKRQKALLIEGSGVDTRHFDPSPYLPRSAGRVNFLYMGRLLRNKGIVEYLEAARRLAEQYEEVTCWVLGGFDGANQETISKSILEEHCRHPRINYLGVQEDVRAVLGAAHVLVLPSDSEGIARSLLEALAMQLPIITTDIPGCQETVEHGHNGLLVACRDSELLLDAMKKMMELGPEKRAKMGRAGRKLALRRFDESIIVGCYLRLVRQMAFPDEVRIPETATIGIVPDAGAFKKPVNFSEKG